MLNNDAIEVASYKTCHKVDGVGLPKNPCIVMTNCKIRIPLTIVTDENF